MIIGPEDLGHQQEEQHTRLPRKQNFERLELVEIRWDDASNLAPDWVDPDEEKPAPQWVSTVGFLVADTEHYVVIAHTTDGTFVNGRFQIPKGMIRSMKPLRKKRKPKKVPDAAGN